MPRVSHVDGFESGEIPDALEWIVGDAAEFAALWETEDSPPAPVDLTGATIDLVFEFYFASVTATGRAGGGQSISVSALRRDTGRATRAIAATVDADQAAHTGEFAFHLPDDLYPGNQPAADITTRVPIAIVYLCRTIGAETLTVRFITVFRRGKP